MKYGDVGDVRGLNGTFRVMVLREAVVEDFPTGTFTMGIGMPALDGLSACVVIAVDPGPHWAGSYWIAVGEIGPVTDRDVRWL